MQRALKASSKCQGKASALMCVRLAVPAQAQGTSLASLALVGAEKPPNLGPLTAALKLSATGRKYHKLGSASLLATTF